MDKKVKVILDCDMAIGKFGSDIDDAFAYIWLKEETELLGITCVHGNAKESKCFDTTVQMTNLLNDDVGVYHGAGSKDSLGKKTDAVDFICQTVKKYPEQVVIVAVGPLTNIASVALYDREAFNKIKKIVIMGGFDKDKPPFIKSEFNFIKSAKAAKIVCESDISKIFVPSDICLKLVFSKEDLKRLKINNECAEFIKKSTKSWMNLMLLAGAFNILPKGGFVPWDPIAAAGLTHPDRFKCEKCTVTVDENGVSHFYSDSNSNSIVLRDFDKKWFINELIEKINQATN